MKRIWVVMFVLGLSACGGSPQTQAPPAQPQASTPPAARPAVPNRTKAVRLIVVPDGINDGGAKLRDFVEGERAAKNDVYIVGNKPMSYVGGKLLEHKAAVEQDSEALPFVDVSERQREQIQWQSKAEFEITRVEKARESLRTMRRNKPFEFVPDTSAPEMPFAALKGGAKGGPGAPVRSGLASISPTGKGQLYSVSLAITVEGKRREISPAVYLFACGAASECTVDDGPRRTAENTYIDAVVRTMPNRTKVVRLIVLPDGFKIDDPAAVRALVERERAAMTDVFILGEQPLSYIDGKLEDHKVATLDRRTVVFAMVLEREQVQWESNADFVISALKKESKQGYEEYATSPDNPFTIARIGHGGGPGQPLQSGVVNLGDNTTTLGQLYKLAFRFTVNGKPRDVDPDAYCDM